MVGIGVAAQPSSSAGRKECWVAPVPPPELIYTHNALAPTAQCRSLSTQRCVSNKGAGKQRAQLLAGLTGGVEHRPPLTPAPVLPQKEDFISRSGLQSLIWVAERFLCPKPCRTWRHSGPSITTGDLRAWLTTEERDFFQQAGKKKSRARP